MARSDRSPLHIVSVRREYDRDYDLFTLVYVIENHQSPNRAPLTSGARAVVARSAEAQAKARAWGVPKIYSSFEAALQDQDIDALSICTPHYHHAEMILAALAAGSRAVGGSGVIARTKMTAVMAVIGVAMWWATLDSNQ